MSITKIAQIVGDGVLAVFDFQNIPSIYETLELILQGRSTYVGAADGMLLRLNNDSGTNYYHVIWDAVSASVNAAAVAPDVFLDAGAFPGASAPLGAAGISRILLPGYSRTTFHKAALLFGANRTSNTVQGQAIDLHGSHWANVAAVNRVTIYTSSQSPIAAGSVATLYGWA